MNERKTIPGNKSNWLRAADVEAYEGGCVRIQQDGDPVDVVLLTPRQLREIVRMSERQVPA
jgi:hypothetical protein